MTVKVCNMNEQVYSKIQKKKANFRNTQKSVINKLSWNVYKTLSYEKLVFSQK